MNLAERLRSLRQNRNILQKEVAACLKVSIGTISNYENGVHQPDLNTLGRLADFYGVSTDYLLGRSPYPAPSPCIEKTASDRLQEKLFLEISRLPESNLEALGWLIGSLKNYEIHIRHNERLHGRTAGNQIQRD